MLNCKDDGDDSVSDIEGLRVRDITCWQDYEDTYWWLVKNPKAYGTVITDTITQLQFMVVEEIGGAKAVKADKAVGDWGTMTKSDWGVVSSRMKTWITNYRDLPMEVVFLAQDRVFNPVDEEMEQEEGIEPEVGPSLSPALMKHLCAAVSVIGHTLVRNRKVFRGIGKKKREVELTEYCLRLGPSPSYITKIRKPKDAIVPDFLTDTNYETILDNIKGAN